MKCDSYLSLIKTLELIKKKCKSKQVLLTSILPKNQAGPVEKLISD